MADEEITSELVVVEETTTEIVEAPEPPPLETLELRKAWEDLQGRMGDTSQRKALRYLLGGYTYREAAVAAGYSSWGHLHEAVVKHNLRGVVNATDRLIQSHRQVAILATEQLQQRGAEGFPNTDDRDLAVIAGISSDKVQKFEDKQEAGNQGAEFFKGLLESLEASGTKLSIVVEPSKRDDSDPVEIDVESTEL